MLDLDQTPSESITNLSRIAEPRALDAAAAYSISYRAWQAFAGVATLVLLARYLSPIEQGVYFTFASLIAFQVVIELGLTFVSTQFASHEMAGLHWTADRILTGSPGAKARVRGLVQFTTRWTGIGAMALAVAFVPLGLAFLGLRPEVEQAGAWRIAWTWLVLTTAGSLALDPLFAILEGCDRVAEVARFRTFQDITAYAAFWATLALGGGLLAYPILQSVRLLLSLWWLNSAYGAAWEDLAKTPESAGSLNWREEIWPMQWRIAISWLASFSIFQLFSPIAFVLIGAKDAGRLGMTVTATSGITTVAMTLVYAKVPSFGRLIAQRRFAELDVLFARTVRVALLLAGMAGLCLWSLVALWGHLDIVWRYRVLDPLNVGLLAALAVVNVLVFSLATYLRAHKQEPLVANSLVGAAVTPVVLYAGAKLYGITGMVTSYCLVTFTAGLAWILVIFLQKRRVWHQERPA